MTGCKSLKRRLALASLLAVLSAPAAATTTTEDFTLQTGAQLVDLCSTKPDDPLYTAAIHMCEGFGVGVYRTILALTTYKGAQPLFCPQEGITRDEAFAMFREWAKSNMQHASEPPADFIARFLIETSPCPK
jgi:hypothetical protein